ncbi:MAG TPA: tyrosine-type recombinase/integrase [Methylophilus sp.]
MLTNKKIDGAKPQVAPYKLTDAHGLYIHILPTGTKSWRFNYSKDGKNKTKTFGQYPNIGVADARQLLNAFKLELAQGTAEVSETFDTFKNKWLIHKKTSLRNAKHKQQIEYRLDTFVSPHIGKRPIDSLKRADFVDIVQRVQNGGIVETAHRVAIHIRQVMDYAVDMGLIESHAASGLSRVLKAPKVKHMNCIPVEQAATLFKAINSYDEPITRLGLIFAALTFIRTNELRYMQWSEIQDKRFWVIPAERMKMKKPHVVPLSEFALKILDELEVHTGDYDLVFHSPTRPNKPISENTLLFALYRLGYRGIMTVHGFRALASTVLNEQSPFSHDVIERQLAHKETDQVRAAYNRAEYLDERIKLMDWWSEKVQTWLLNP